MKKTKAANEQVFSARIDDRKRYLLYLIGLYAGAVLIRVLLTLLFRPAPSIVIDESLYTNIARSLADAGKPEYRAQPISYPYLLYPFLLVPIYRLQRLLGGDIYRYIQIFNAILINASVFPAFFFAKEFTGCSWKAFATAVITAMMPDMAMNTMLMSESVIWPLFLCVIYFGYRMFRNTDRSSAYLTALITALMFFTKPGSIVAGAVILIIYLLYSVIKKQNQAKAIRAVAVLVSLILLGYGLYFLLQQEDRSLIGLYSKQLSDWEWKKLILVIEATVAMCFLFVAVCGGLFGVLPIVYLKAYREEKKLFVETVLLGLGVTILGTAVFVVPFKWNGSFDRIPLQLRYFSMYVPVFAALSLGVDIFPKEKEGNAVIRYTEKKNVIIGALCILAVLLIVPGIGIGMSSDVTPVDSMTLSAHQTMRKLISDGPGYISTAILITSCAYAIFFFAKGWNEKKNAPVACLILFGFLLFNSAFSYVWTTYNVEGNEVLHKASADALEINGILNENETALGITQRHYDDIHSYYLEAHLNKPLQMVTTDQIFVESCNTKGVYVPFVPLDQPPNFNSHTTVDTTLLILGESVGENMELSPDVTVRKTTNGYYAAVTVRSGERWIDTMMYGLDGNKLLSGTEATLGIFSDDRNIDGNVILEMRAYGSGTVVIGNTSIPMTDTLSGYRIIIPYSVFIHLKAEGGDVIITTYKTERVE